MTDRAQYVALMDRQSRGESLTPQELAFCETFIDVDPSAARVESQVNW